MPRGYAENAVGTTLGPRPRPDAGEPPADATKAPTTPATVISGPEALAATEKPGTVISGPRALAATNADNTEPEGRPDDAAETGAPETGVDRPVPDPVAETVTDDDDGAPAA